MTSTSKRPAIKVAVYVIHSPDVSTFRSANVAKLQKVFAAIQQRRSTNSDGEFQLTRFQVIGRQHEPDSVAREHDLKQITDVRLSDDLQSPYDRLMVPLNVKHISNALKHLEALREISRSGHGSSQGGADQEEINLVLEDDVLYNEQLMEASLVRAMGARPMRWDVLFLGLPTSLDDTSESNIRFQEAASVFKVFPSCESYIVRPEAAARLAERFLPLRFPTNVQLSWLLLGPHAPEVGLHSYIMSPSIFLDGSKYGTCTSTINMNNRLTWNPEYVRMFGLVRGKPDDFTKEDAIEVDRLYEAMNFKNHPDAVYLYAMSFVRRGEHAKAEDMMAKALKQYDANKCVLNRGSEFLNVYCDLFRHLQPDVQIDRETR